MTTLFRNNRNPFTLLTIIITFVLMYIDYRIENQSSTIIQWVLFIAGTLFSIYLQFSDLADDIEYEEEHYDLADLKAEKIIEEQEKDKSIAFEEIVDSVIGNDSWILEEPAIDWKDNKPVKPTVQNNKKDGSRTVYMVQPIIVTEEEFNNKIKQTDMKPEETKTPTPGPGLSSGPVKELPVETYSLHNVNKKWRALVDDICSFCTRGEKKTEAEIIKKIAIYGQPYQIERKQGNLIAFKFDFIRLPQAGYFGLKTKEEEAK